jgi:hypothetical protein
MELVAAAERKNGSERLKNVKTIELFTPKQVHKITKDNSIPLGKGGFGEVYKGTLQDKTEVAVQDKIEAPSEEPACMAPRVFEFKFVFESDSN